ADHLLAAGVVEHGDALDGEEAIAVAAQNRRREARIAAEVPVFDAPRGGIEQQIIAFAHVPDGRQLGRAVGGDSGKQGEIEIVKESALLIGQGHDYDSLSSDYSAPATPMVR